MIRLNLQSLEFLAALENPSPEQREEMIRLFPLVVAEAMRLEKVVAAVVRDKQ